MSKKQEENAEVVAAEVVTEPEQTEAVATVEEDELSMATQFEDNDPMMVSNIPLPTEDDTTMKKVDDALKASFDNFTFDENEDMSLQFDDIESLADYSMRSMKDIREKELKKDAQNRTKNAAILVRLWCLCKTWSDAAAKSKKYGAGAVQKLAALTVQGEEAWYEDMTDIPVYVDVKNVLFKDHIQLPVEQYSPGVGFGWYFATKK